MERLLEFCYHVLPVLTLDLLKLLGCSWQLLRTAQGSRTCSSSRPCPGQMVLHCTVGMLEADTISLAGRASAAATAAD